MVKMKNGLKVGGVWRFVCRNSQGEIKWTEELHNIFPNGVLDHVLDVAFSGGSQNATWYVGLISDTPTIAATDTMSSHAGWTEFTGYDEAARQTWTEAGVSSQSITNSASTADFTITSNSSVIAGAFLTTVSTKGGTTGILGPTSAFSADKNGDAGDTLSVTYTLSAADDGA